jgi:hypothetical protein
MEPLYITTIQPLRKKQWTSVIKLERFLLYSDVLHIARMLVCECSLFLFLVHHSLEYS